MNLMSSPKRPDFISINCRKRGSQAVVREPSVCLAFWDWDTRSPQAHPLRETLRELEGNEKLLPSDWLRRFNLSSLAVPCQKLS